MQIKGIVREPRVLLAALLLLGAPACSITGETSESAIPIGVAAEESRAGGEANWTGLPEEMLRALRRDGEAPVIDRSLSLSECIAMALEFNRKRPASRFQVEIARAQHRQAIAGYFPQTSIKALSNLRSDDISFIFPETQYTLEPTSISVPASTIAIPDTTFQTKPLTFTVPANSLGPGFPAADIEVPVGSQKIPIQGQNIQLPAQEYQISEQTFTIPEQEVDLMDRVTHSALFDVKWLLLDGGWRRSLREQAKGAIEAATADAKRTDFDIVFDVTRFYKGLVLALEAEREAARVIERMDASLQLTKDLVDGGSLRVTQLDYLEGMREVGAFKVQVKSLKERRLLAEAALVHAIGLSWESKIQPEDKKLDFRKLDADLANLISEAYKSSPDWQKLQAGLKVYAAQVKEQKSLRRPRLAFLGNAQSTYNELDTGFASDSNLNSWNVGLGVEIPFFDGGLGRSRVREAKNRLAHLEETEKLVRQKLAWGVKSLFARIETIEEKVAQARAAQAAAVESRELAEMAYTNDLAEAEDVFDAQVAEAEAIAMRLFAEYEHAEAVARLDSVIGRDFRTLFGGSKEVASRK